MIQAIPKNLWQSFYVYRAKKKKSKKVFAEGSCGEKVYLELADVRLVSSNLT